MAIRERRQLGAPGVYPRFDEPLRALTGVRMDVAAFVGVAPRGPSRLPAYDAWWANPPGGPAAPTAPLRSVAVPIESWDAYRRLYGSFEGPGLLPYAVAAFFQNGGRRAYVVRIVHDYGAGHPANAEAIAKGSVPGMTPRSGGNLVLRARDEGSWGNRLRASVTFRSRPLRYTSIDGAKLILATDTPVGAGTLIRFWLSGGIPLLRFVTDIREVWSPERPTRVLEATLESVLPNTPERAEIVEAELAITDGGRDGIARDEVHERLGLSPLHPRWVAAVLYRDSHLVYPEPSWIGDDLIIDDPLLRTASRPDRRQFSGGRDRYASIVPDDFFDSGWVPGDDQRRSGIHALLDLDEVSIVVAPDLYSPGPIAPLAEAEEIVSLAGSTFEECVVLPSLPPPDVEGNGSDEELDGLQLDPTLPSDRDRIISLQSRMVEIAEQTRSWITLLDVPPGLNQREILAWRSHFGSAWAAAYHPWIQVSRPDDARNPLVMVNPSAFAAGIVAQRELLFGVPHGPANELVRDAVSLVDRVSPQRHDDLHQAAINVLVAERDGIRLTGARTLSSDPQWRQLSVRRLMTMLQRTLLQQMQWAVFEANDARFRDELQRLLEGYLQQLFRANAFRGRTARQSYFVRCDAGLNPPQRADRGEVLCHIGVAPAEPLEFIVLHLSRGGDGILRLEE